MNVPLLGRKKLIVKSKHPGFRRQIQQADAIQEYNVIDVFCDCFHNELTFEL